MGASYHGSRVFFKKEKWSPIKTLLALSEEGFTGVCELIFEDNSLVYESRILYIDGYVVALDLYLNRMFLKGEKALAFARRNSLYSRRGVVWFDIEEKTLENMIMEGMIDEDEASLKYPLKALSFISW